MNILVVPTIREESIKKFLSSWEGLGGWDEIIVVEDNPTPQFKIHASVPLTHYSWKDIDADLEEKSWIISRRDSAIRSYGFLKAYQKGANYILTLDDDCYPPGLFLSEGKYNFTLEHIKRLNNTHKIWTSLIPRVRTRGLPYRNLGIMTGVVFNIGLWQGVPDYDAVKALNKPNTENFAPPSEDRIIPNGQLMPFCGMNFSFKRKVTPLCYFPLMGKDSPYSRFDDMWFGIIAKKICDHLKLNISCGNPHVHHSKASDPFDNLIKEAPGIKMNEKFWEYVYNIDLKGNSVEECMHEVGGHLRKNTHHYIAKLGAAIIIWTSLF